MNAIGGGTDRVLVDGEVWARLDVVVVKGHSLFPLFVTLQKLTSRQKLTKYQKLTSRQ